MKPCWNAIVFLSFLFSVCFSFGATPYPLPSQATSFEQPPSPTNEPTAPTNAIVPSPTPTAGESAREFFGNEYPKNLCDFTLTPEIYVNSSTGFKPTGEAPLVYLPWPNYVSSPNPFGLLAGADHLYYFEQGLHSFTIKLRDVEPLSLLTFLNYSATGAFAVYTSTTNVEGPWQPIGQKQFNNPNTIEEIEIPNTPSQFVRIDFHITKPGIISSLAMFGDKSELDYALAASGMDTPATTTPSNVVEYSVSSLSAGAKVTRVSSMATPEQNPQTVLADKPHGSFSFEGKDPAPTLQIDLGTDRKISRVALTMHAPAGTIELYRIINQSPTTAFNRNFKNPWATITKFKGQVMMMNLDGSGLMQVQVGSVLDPGKMIKTEPQAEVEMEMQDESMIRLGPNTMLGLENQKDTYFSLRQGSMLWQVLYPGTGGILMTPEITAPVKGTTMIADVGMDGTTKVSLLETSRAEGMEVQSNRTGQAVNIIPGESVLITAPAPEKLQIQPIDIKSVWMQNSLCAVFGNLKHDVQSQFLNGGQAQDPEQQPESVLLATLDVQDGINVLSASFPETTARMLEIRFKPTMENQSNSVSLLKAHTFGRYPMDDVTIFYQGIPIPQSSNPPLPFASNP